MKSHYRKLLQVQLGKDTEEVVQRRDTPRKENRSGVAKILVVDDDPGFLEFASFHLETNGYEVVTAQSASEAKSILQARSDIGLVVTDLKMPFEDGFVVLDFLRDNLRFNHIPAIVTTCMVSTQFVARAINYGAIDYLAKPYTGVALLQRVKSALSRSKGALLIVVEEDLQYSILERALSSAGYSTSRAADCQQAKAKIAENHYAVVISDLVLNDGTGLDLLLMAKEIRPSTEVVFLQDQSVRATDEEIRAAGGRGLIERPIKNTDVVQAVRMACSVG